MVIAHFNWVTGLANKTALLKRAGMWLLAPDGRCLAAGSAAAGLLAPQPFSLAAVS